MRPTRLHRPSVLIVLALWFAGLLFPPESEAEPVDARSRVTVTTANAKSTLDRVSGRLTSTVDVTLENTGDRLLEAPLHAAVHFTAQSGTLADLSVTGAAGGLDQGPYGTFFFDLTPQIAAGLAPGAKVTFNLRFSPAKSARVTFEVRPFATVNQDPIVNAGGPYTAQAGQEIAFDASGSSDPEGGALTFQWNFGDGSPAGAGATIAHTYATAGAFEAVLKVTDAKGAEKLVRIPVTVTPAEPFALARVRVLSGAGLPLGGATIQETQLGGPERQLVSNGSSGFASLGSGAGGYRWKFSKPGHLDVWRVKTLSLGQVGFIPNPWLAEISPNPVRISPLVDGVVSSARVELAFGAGAFIQPSDIALTELNTQSLPFPLPAGWSPLAQFHAGFSVEPTRPGSARLTLPASLVAGTPAAWVKYAPGMFRWETLEVLEAPGGPNVSAAIASSGWYALVVPDLGAAAPPQAVAGEPLPESTSPLATGGFAASGAVTPGVAAASLDAEKVTGKAVVNFTHANAPPSGVVFQTRISETYELSDGTKTRTPDYDTTIFAYQRPAGLRAEFPLRPQVLFGPSELREAIVRVNVLESSAFAGAVFGNAGGQLSKDGVRVVAPPGAIDAPQAAELAIYDVQSLSGVGGAPAIAKAFSLSVNDLGGGARFGFFFDALVPNTHYVLGRIVTDDEGLGITPLERFLSDGSGVLASIEPATGTRLPGVTGPGDYALVQIAGLQAIVQGIARDISGQPAAGLAIRTANQPWLVFSAQDGSYLTLGAVGPGLITVVDPRDGNEGSSAIDVIDPGAPQTADITTGPTGPRVASTSPAADALNVRAVEPIIVRFSEPISPGSLGGAGVRLRDTVANADVPAATSLDVSNRILTLFPTNPLVAGTAHEIIVSPGIRDLQNLPIEGPLSFAFATVPAEARPPGAQLVIYEPGAQNVPASVLDQLVGYTPGVGSSHVVAQGSAGVADPLVAVILVNESTGTTETVLSKADGSFASFIAASAEDFVTAVFVNGNGTRISVPATRQLFDDGRVGLYRGGGILEAESDGGPVQVIVKPEAIKSRSVFKIEPLGLAQLLALVQNQQPQDATILGGAKVTIDGDKPAGEIDVSFPVDPANLGLPPGTPPEDAAVALTVPREIDGVTAYQVVDKLRYENGRVFSNTAPFDTFGNPGVISPEGALNFGPPSFQLAGGVFTGLIMPMTIGIKPVTVTGTVVQVPQLELPPGIETLLNVSLAVFGINGTVQDFNAFRPVSGALVSFQRPGQGNAVAGRIQPGLVFATSERDGKYALVVPTALVSGFLKAVHPRLGVQTASLGIQTLAFQVGTAGAVRRNIFFPTPRSVFANLVPRVVAAHAPLFPALDQPAKLRLDITMNGLPNVIAAVTEVVSLVPGVETTLEDAVVGAPTLDHPDANHSTWTADITCAKAALVKLRLTVVRPDTNDATTIAHVIEFGGAPAPPNTDLPASDPNDRVGPMVVRTSPAAGDILQPGQPLLIQFNEPIDRGILTHPELIGVVPALDALPSLDLSADQRILRIGFPKLPPGGGTITVTIPQFVRDLVPTGGGNSHDQDPSTPGAQTFNVTLRAGTTVVNPLAGIGNGGGAVYGGNVLYVLDRANGGSIKAFDGTNPASPALLASVPVPGFPRDLVFIPKYSFFPGLTAIGSTLPAVEKDLLVVVGGESGTINTDNNVAIGQYLRIYDVTDPLQLSLIKSVRVTIRNTLVTKVRWRPPLLAYLEAGSDLQSVGFIDLQELLLGFSVPPANLVAALPLARQPGKDLNGDGDYTDTGEKPPIPDAAPAEFFGKVFALTAGDGTTRTILDFDFDAGYLGVTLSGGVKLSGTGNPTAVAVPPAYQTILFNGQELEPTAGFFNFAAADRPKRLTTLFGVPVLIGGQTQLRVISLVSLSPSANGTTQLAIVDITLPTQPTLLQTIEFPSSLGIGLLQSARARADGLIQIATTTDAVVIDPAKFGAPATASTGALPPSVIGILRGAGSGNISVGHGPAGLTAIALGGRNEIVEAAPEMLFVNFPSEAGVVAPNTLAIDREGRRALLGRMRVESIIRPARFRSGSGAISALNPPSPAAHHHVLIRAPGGAGAVIPLALEALNSAGEALRNRGPGFAPPRAASADTINGLKLTPQQNFDAPVPAFKAWRLSDDRFDPDYNLYLSEPFAVVRERMTAQELTALQNPGAPRVILWSDQLIRATIDPSAGTLPGVGSFAAELDQFLMLLRPKVAVLASTLPGGYIMGPNPAPMGGELGVPGTFGLVNAANGEVRHKTVDIELPSPRMPIQFRRVSNNQDTVAGPFGKGWDFNYNQRLVELKEELFPPGNREPIITRNTEDKSVIAKNKDVELHDGNGRTIVFEFSGEASDAPDAFTADPLITELEWLNQSGRCYLPHRNEKGVFDLLYRFPSGEFVRLTPSGMQYRYDPDGRLGRIIDRYEKNQHLVIYDTRGRLIRILDTSVDGDRYLDIGYFRAGQDTDFRQSIDEVATVETHVDKICRLKDYAGRDVLFEYDPRGVLLRRKSFEVTAANGGFSGRSVESYEVNPDNATLTAVRAGSGANGGGGNNGGGVALFAASTQQSVTNGVPVATGGTGAGGGVSVNVPLDNTAASVGDAARSATGPDGSGITFDFDEFGYPSEVRMTGDSLPDAKVESAYNDAGLLESVTLPEGNTVTYTYNLANRVLRARPNVKTIIRDPGGRGGDQYTATFSYDERYNLKSGTQKDFNGNSIAYTLHEDGRDIESIDYVGAGVHSFEHNANGQVELESTPHGVKFDPSYDSQTGFLTKLQRGDLQWQFGYNSTIAGKLGMSTSTTPPAGTGFTQEYDERLLLTKKTRGAQEESFAYDENGNATLIKRKVDTAQTFEEKREFDQISFLKKSTIRQVETTGGVTDLVTEYTPDSAFRVSSIKLPGGETRKIFYNHLGDTRRMEIGQYVEDYGRDLNGNILTVSQGGELVQKSVFDGHDRPTEVRTKAGAGDDLVEMSYFGNGELKSRKVSGPNGGMVADISVVTIDALGRPREVSRKGNQVGTATQTITYTQTATGLTMTTNGPVETNVETKTDSAGRLVSQTDSLRTSAYTVDGNFNLQVSDVTEEGTQYKTTFGYDGLDHLKSVSDLVGLISDMTPRLDGGITTLKDARGNSLQQTFSVLGELLRIDRPESLQFNYAYDENRQRASVTDRDGKGNVDAHTDGTLRLTKTELRDPSRVLEFSDPDARNLPQTVTIPGGSMTFTYDQQGRATSYVVSYGGGPQNYDFNSAKYDALGRLRSAGYGAGGTNKLTMEYDLLGTIKSTSYQEPGGTYDTSASVRADGMRVQLTYPSTFSIAEERQPSGRLKSISSPGGAIWTAVDFAGADIPKTEDFGGVIRLVNEYDARKRLLKRRYEKVSGGALLAEMRFLYDSTDNLLARQFLHAHGRGDIFSYDNANRLRTAEYGARPVVAGSNRPGANGLSGGEGLAKGLVARDYSYDGGGLDLLLGGVLVNPDNLPASAFAEDISGHDAYLQADTVDGFSRGPSDPLGNTSRTMLFIRQANQTEPIPVPASLKYNGLGHLVQVSRDDGVNIDYEYRPDGLMHHRTVSQGGTVLSDTQFVWHDGRLLEEYDVNGGGSQLRARYFYGDGDAPVAADLTSGLQRHYYLADNVWSTVAVADANGDVVERISYDAWGQPLISGKDVSSPQIAEVRRDGDDVLVVFTEPVLPPIGTGGGTGLVTQSDDPAAAFRLDTGSGLTPPQVTFEENAPELPFGSVYRLRPASSASASITVQVIQGKLVDEWGNGVVAETRAMPFGPGPILFTGTIGTGGTAAPRRARSEVVSPFLFHGQWFDFDTGLSYMRARFYDPFTGQFLQRDPLNYSDSVNLYAAFGQRPTVTRDPTGASWLDVFKGLFSGRKGKALANTATEVVQPQRFRPAMQGKPRSYSVAQAPPRREEVTQISSNPFDEATDVEKTQVDRVARSFDDEVTQVSATIGASAARPRMQAAPPPRKQLLAAADDPAFKKMDEFLKEANTKDFIYVFGHADTGALSVKLGGKWIDLHPVTLRSALGTLPPDVQVVFMSCNFGGKVGTGGAAKISRLLPDRTVWAAEGFVRIQGNPQLLAFASMFGGDFPIDVWRAAWKNRADFDEMGGFWRGFKDGNAIHELQNLQFHDFIRRAP